MALLDTGHVVQSVDRVAGKFFEQAVIHHRLCTGFAFFRRLKDEMQGAVEFIRFRQVARRAQQHRRMAVMAAGMHLAFMDRLVIEGVLFVDIQGVHIGAQSDGAI